jgi:hypothetical protein
MQPLEVFVNARAEKRLGMPPAILGFARAGVFL